MTSLVWRWRAKVWNESWRLLSSAAMVDGPATTTECSRWSRSTRPGVETTSA